MVKQRNDSAKIFIGSRPPIFLRHDSFLSRARVPTRADLCDGRSAPGGGDGGETSALNAYDYALVTSVLNAYDYALANDALNGG